MKYISITSLLTFILFGVYMYFSIQTGDPRVQDNTLSFDEMNFIEAVAFLYALFGTLTGWLGTLKAINQNGQKAWFFTVLFLWPLHPFYWLFGLPKEY